MKAQARAERIELFERRCRDHGFPFTVQRRLILEAIFELDDHPPADRVHEPVAARVAGISRATVYRTLDTLVRMGVITRVCHPGKSVGFDVRTETHHRLLCLRRDTIADISDDRLTSLPTLDTSGYGFVVSDFRVQLRGLCRPCREEEEEP